MTFDVFVGVMYCAQIAYLLTLLATKNEALLVSATEGVSVHFVLFNLLQIMQIVTWTKEVFILTAVCLVLNAVNLILLAFRLGPAPHKTTIMKNITVHIPLVKLPLAFTLWFVWRRLSTYKLLTAKLAPPDWRSPMSQCSCNRLDALRAFVGIHSLAFDCSTHCKGFLARIGSQLSALLCRNGAVCAQASESIPIRVCLRSSQHHVLHKCNDWGKITHSSSAVIEADTR